LKRRSPTLGNRPRRFREIPEQKNSRERISTSRSVLTGRKKMDFSRNAKKKGEPFLTTDLEGKSLQKRNLRVGGKAKLARAKV